MAQQFFTNAEGKYIGSFDGAHPPKGSIEVAFPPQDGRQVFKDGDWSYPEELLEQVNNEIERKAYEKAGLNDHEMIVALWKKFMEADSAKADAIQVERVKVQESFES